MTVVVSLRAMMERPSLVRRKKEKRYWKPALRMPRRKDTLVAPLKMRGDSSLLVQVGGGLTNSVGIVTAAAVGVSRAMQSWIHGVLQ